MAKKITPQTQAEGIIVQVRVYKDGWTPSRPWCADLIHADGQVFRKYNWGYKSKKRLLENIDHMMSLYALSVGSKPEIVRGEDI